MWRKALVTSLLSKHSSWATIVVDSDSRAISFIIGAQWFWPSNNSFIYKNTDNFEDNEEHNDKCKTDPTVDPHVLFFGIRDVKEFGVKFVLELWISCIYYSVLDGGRLIVIENKCDILIEMEDLECSKHDGLMWNHGVLQWISDVDYIS